MIFARVRLDRELWIYIAGAFLVFVMCFFAMYIKEAEKSGSWRYVINNQDEFFYWVTADGVTETPQSDANPFYFEEKGIQLALPHVTANLFGYAAKFFNLPVLFFFPLWHIGMPFLLWGSMFICFVKIWKYPVFNSAAAALFFIAITFYLKGLSPLIAVRFSHPGDGLWLLVIWLSLITHLDRCSWTRVAWLWGIAFAAFWLQPMYVIPGCLVTAAEGLWYLKKRDFSRSSKSFSVLGAVCLAGVLLYIQMKIFPPVSSLLLKESMRFDKTASYGEIIPSFLLYGAVIFSVLFPKMRNKESLTPLDRLTISLFTIEPLIITLSCFLNFAIILTHRYYFLLLEMACMFGLVFQNAPGFFQSIKSKYYEKFVLSLFFLLQMLTLWRPELTPFHHGMMTSSNFLGMHDNILLISSIFPSSLLVAWMFFRFPVLTSALKNRMILMCGIIVLTGFGFFTFSSGPDELSRKSLFDGAYRWLDRNTPPDSVILTASPKANGRYDYLPLYTHQKIYRGALSVYLDRVAQGYRDMFMAALFLGILDEITMDGITDMPGKLRRFRLDYVLIERASPFFNNIEKSLNGHIQEVYRENSCLIWKVLA